MVLGYKHIKELVEERLIYRLPHNIRNEPDEEIRFMSMLRMMDSINHCIKSILREFAPRFVIINGIRSFYHYHNHIVTVDDITNFLFSILNRNPGIKLIKYRISFNSVTTLNLNHMDVSKVTTLNSCFNRCNTLITLKISDWDVSNVANLAYCFSECTRLKFLDISKWDVSKVTDMSNCFYKCTELEFLNIGEWDVSRVTNLKYCFGGCMKLKNLNISNWDVSKVSNLCNCFESCESLNILDLNSWDVSKVTDLSSCFEYCIGLKLLNVSSWDTSKVTNLSHCFRECPKLSILNLLSWSVKTSRHNRFSDDEHIKMINCKNNIESLVNDVNEWEHIHDMWVKRK